VKGSQGKEGAGESRGERGDTGVDEGGGERERGKGRRVGGMGTAL
jgi:hypothetical protein